MEMSDLELCRNWRANPTHSCGWIVPILVFAYAQRAALAISSTKTVAGLTFDIPIWFVICITLVAAPAISGLEFARGHRP
jgi:hypothetical protein